ncbi:hypothetical protein [Clostridium botulinum]|uniref:hypothetical protein n=1 Tax=Clostridium botulinum TaxID=1491 RepID=UPI0006A4F921|nr:hypothetical protein [Clostridium botulinum]KOC45488.1 hypothetical protein ADU88_13675 [Clostridium botulinum]
MASKNVSLEAPIVGWAIQTKEDTKKYKDISEEGWNFSRVNAGETSKQITETSFAIFNNVPNVGITKGSDEQPVNGKKHVAPMTDCLIYVADQYGSNNTVEVTDEHGNVIKKGTPKLVKDNWVEYQGITYPPINSNDWRDLGAKNPISIDSKPWLFKAEKIGANGKTVVKTGESLSGTIYDKSGDQAVTNGDYTLADNKTVLHNCLLGLANEGNGLDATTFASIGANMCKFKLRINIPIDAKSDKIKYLLCVTYDHN